MNETGLLSGIYALTVDEEHPNQDGVLPACIVGGLLDPVRSHLHVDHVLQS